MIFMVINTLSEKFITFLWRTHANLKNQSDACTDYSAFHEVMKQLLEKYHSRDFREEASFLRSGISSKSYVLWGLKSGVSNEPRDKWTSKTKSESLVPTVVLYRTYMTSYMFSWPMQHLCQASHKSQCDVCQPPGGGVVDALAWLIVSVVVTGLSVPYGLTSSLLVRQYSSGTSVSSHITKTCKIRFIVKMSI